MAITGAIPSWVLDAHRAELEATFLVETCVVKRPVHVPNAHGSSTTTFITALTTTAHLNEEDDAEAREEGGRQVAETWWKVTLPATVVVQPQDRLEIGGNTYEVIGVESQRTQSLLAPVRCRRLNVSTPLTMLPGAVSAGWSVVAPTLT